MLDGVATVSAPADTTLWAPAITLATAAVQHHDSYRLLLDKADDIPPIPCAVAHPCDESSLRGAVEAAAARLIVPILVGPAAQDPRPWPRSWVSTSARLELDRRAAQPRGRGQGGRAGPGRQGRAVDEGQPAHRRADGRGGGQGDRPAHRAADQPCVHHGRADLRGPAVHHRRCDQHLPGPRDQGRHRPERDRPASRPGTGRAARGHPVGGRDREPQDSRHARRRRLVQDGRSRPDQGRHPRRPAGARQRDQPGGRPDQGHRLPGGGPGADPGRPRPRGRQHAGQEPVVHGQRRRGRHRARGAGADHPDQPGRQCPHPHGVLRGGGTLRPRPPRGRGRWRPA